MSDKILTEQEWKKFSKGRELKDALLVKALEALDKAKAPDQEIAALADIEKQADLLRKAAKGNKDITSYLDDLDKAVDKQRKLSEAEARKPKASEGEDEADSPALLTSRMIPLLREVRKGDLVLQALVAVAGKETVVLLSRRAISPSSGKLLKEYMTNSGGLKFIRGECIYEENAVTFVVQQSPAGGLAKKIKTALLAQTDMRVKVRVRGEDPDDIDEEGEDGDESAPGPQAGDAGAAAGPATGTAPGAAAAGAQAYAARLAALQPRVEEALKAKHPESTKLRGVSSFAGEKADAGDYATALKSLDMLEKLLGPSAGGNAALELALAAWREAREQVIAQLKDVVDELKQDLAEDPDDELAQGAELEVNAVMRQLTSEPRSQQQVNELTRWVEQDDVVTTVDTQFGNVRDPLSQALAGLRQALGQTA